MLNMEQIVTEKTNDDDLMETANLHLLSSDQLRQIIRDYATVHGVSFADIAIQSELGASTMSAWVNNKYLGSNVNIEEKVRKWIKARKAFNRQRDFVPHNGKFIVTGAAQKCLTVLEYAQSMPDIGVIVGEPGTGKTSTIRHYKANHPNVWLLTASPSVAQHNVVLDALRELMGIPLMRNYLTLRQIIAKTQGTQGLLIIDEAQFLHPQALDELRSIHDQAEVGLVFAGNQEVWRQLDGGGQKAKFAQLHSRVGARVNLGRPNLRDIGDILDAYEVLDKEQRGLLRGIAQKPGGLRAMIKTLNLAYRVARGNGNELTAAHISAAYGHRSGALDVEA